MKKIVLAFDGLDFPEGAFAFIRYLNGISPLMVAGAFVPLLDYSNVWSYATGTAGDMIIPLIEDENAEQLKHNILDFENRCKNADIPFKVHKDFYGLATQELINETRFSDLLFIGSNAFYQYLGGDLNDYLKEILHKSECPVLIYPENFEPPQSLIFAYDGSASSVYAIKQFSYLFPELGNLPALFLYVTGKEDAEIPEVPELEELTSLHFKDLQCLKLIEGGDKGVIQWLGEKKNPILVGGAFGRSFLSQLFKNSFMNEIISKHKFPVFISHK